MQTPPPPNPRPRNIHFNDCPRCRRISSGPMKEALQEMKKDMEELRAENLRLSALLCELKTGGSGSMPTRSRCLAAASVTERDIDMGHTRSSVMSGSKAPPIQSSLWPAPTVLRKGDYNDLDYCSEREMTYSELFIDLIFSVAIARLNVHLLKRGPTHVNIWSFTIYFMHMWSIWYEALFYSTRFGTNDVPNMIFFSVITGCVCFMTIHLTCSEHGTNVRAFANSAAAARFTFLVGYVRIWAWMETEAGVTTGRLTVLKCALLLCCFGSAGICHTAYPSFAWKCIVAAVVIDYGFFQTGRYLLKYVKCLQSLWGNLVGLKIVPWHLEHINERVGGFVVLFLGEAISDVTSKTSVSLDFYSMVAAGFSIVVCLKVLSFDVDVSDIDNHAIRRSTDTTMLWFWCIFFTCLGITIFGGGMKAIFYHEAGDPFPMSSRRQELTCYGLAMVVASMCATCLTHKRSWHAEGPLTEEQAVLRRVFWFQRSCQLASAVLACNLPSVGLTDHNLLWILAAVLMVLVVIDLFDEYVQIQQQDNPEEPSPRGPLAAYKLQSFSSLSMDSIKEEDMDSDECETVPLKMSL